MAHIAAAHLNAEIILMVDSVPSHCRYHFCEPDVKLKKKILSVPP